MIELPGLDRLLTACSRLGLSVLAPPAPASPRLFPQEPPLDPGLTAFYSRFERLLVAEDLYLLRADELERKNARWRQTHQPQLALPLFVFGGRASLAYYHATVPSLADAKGLQPVVEVDAYETPYALPVASSVDRFLDTYSRYLEELVVQPDYHEPGDTPLVFPWDVPHLLARDARLVDMVRSGQFAPLIPQDDETRRWAEHLLAAASSASPSERP